MPRFKGTLPFPSIEMIPGQSVTINQLKRKAPTTNTGSRFSSTVAADAPPRSPPLHVICIHEMAECEVERQQTATFS